VTSSPVTAAIPVVAGPWSATLEVDGSLYGLCYQGVEILRGLAVVVRTNTWLTVTPETNVSLIAEDAGFQVAITATNKAAGLHFHGRVKSYVILRALSVTPSKAYPMEFLQLTESD